MRISLSIKTIILCCVFLITGCDNIEKAAKNKRLNGSLHGVLACIENNNNNLISKDLLKGLCAKKHHKEQIKPITGWKAGITSTDDNVAISPSGINKNDFIITRLDMTINWRDKNGKKDSIPVSIDNLWIEPNGKFHTYGQANPIWVSLIYDADIKGIEEFCSDANDNKFCKSWNVDKVWGIPINLN